MTVANWWNRLEARVEAEQVPDSGGKVLAAPRLLRPTRRDLHAQPVGARKRRQPCTGQLSVRARERWAWRKDEWAG